MIEVDKTILGMLIEKVKYHEALAKENLELATMYKNSLSQLMKPESSNVEVNIPGFKEFSNILQSASKGFNAMGTGSNLSIKDVLVKVLKNHGYLMSANELRELYNKYTNKNMDKVGFSPNLSRAVKENALIMHRESTNIIGNKYSYGLPDWFENGKVKQGYNKKKIAVLDGY